MKAGGTDEMYRRENWETHRKLGYGSSKCYTTDVKQQTNDGRSLQKYKVVSKIFQTGAAIYTVVVVA